MRMLVWAFARHTYQIIGNFTSRLILCFNARQCRFKAHPSQTLSRHISALTTKLKPDISYLIIPYINAFATNIWQFVLNSLAHELLIWRSCINFDDLSVWKIWLITNMTRKCYSQMLIGIEKQFWCYFEWSLKTGFTIVFIIHQEKITLCLLVTSPNNLCNPFRQRSDVAPDLHPNLWTLCVYSW